MNLDVLEDLYAVEYRELADGVTQLLDDPARLQALRTSSRELILENYSLDLHVQRYLALYEMTQGKSATRVAQMLNRHDETIHDWVHQYNEQGPQALVYVRTGGSPAISAPMPSSHEARGLTLSAESMGTSFID